MTVLPIVLAAVFLSIIVNASLKRAGIPTVIGYILTGIAITAAFHLEHHEALSHVAEFGIVFLMFTIGLEFSFKALAALRKEVLLFGSLQMAISTALFTAGAMALGIGIKGALIIGLALALSSTAIVLKMLNESGQIQAPFGRKSLGILIFQDLAVIPILMMISIFASGQSDIGALLGKIALDALLVGIIIYLIGKYLLDRLLGWVTRTESSEIFLTTVLFLVIGSAELAHLFGFTYSLGAFLAGMMLAETHYKYQIEAELIPFRDLLMGLFFVTVGMQIDLHAVAENFGWILLVALAVMVVKFGVLWLFLRFFTRTRVAVKTALTLSQVGEFALAIFSLALAQGLLEAKVAQILFGATVLSMVASVFVLTNVRAIADWLTPEPAPEEEPAPLQSSGFSDHFIVCGYGPLGQKVAEKLKRRNVRYLVLEHDIHRFELGRKRGEPIFFANAAKEEILEAFDIERACAVVVATGNLIHTRLIAEAVKKLAPQSNLVVKVLDEDAAKLLADLKIRHLVIQSDVMAERMVEEAMRCDLGTQAHS